VPRVSRKWKKLYLKILTLLEVFTLEDVEIVRAEVKVVVVLVVNVIKLSIVVADAMVK
jgi:hypothetical protein